MAVMRWLIVAAVCAWVAVTPRAYAQVTGSYVTTIGAQFVLQTATIAGSSSLSGAIDLGTTRLSRIEISSWDAANLTFQVSVDNVNFFNLYDSSGNEYTANAAANRAIIIPLADWIGIRYFKIRSGTSGAPVNQSVTRTLNVVSVP